MRRLFIFAIILASINIYAQGFVYDYIENYKDIAISEMNKSGVPASITLSQGMLESNWGRSDLANKANNHFGIKCGSNWNGDSYDWEDDEFKNGRLVKSCFRMYNSSDESFNDHSIFLSKKRYEFLFDYDVTSYKSWAKGLVKAGYATDPKYADKLIMIIEKYGLYEYDSKYTPIGFASSKKSIKIQETNKYNINYINDSRIVYAQKGDTPKSFAKKIGITLNKIIRYNDDIKSKTKRLHKGQIVYLDRKNKTYNGNKHLYITSKKESLVNISQKFGVNLKYLAKINKTNKKKKFRRGSKILLKSENTRIESVVVVSNSKRDNKYLFDEPLSPKE